MANYREPQWLLPNEKNLQYPAAGATQGPVGLTADRHSLYSMDFDGVDDIITIDTSTGVDFSNPFSVSLWAKWTAADIIDNTAGIIQFAKESQTYSFMIGTGVGTNNNTFNVSWNNNNYSFGSGYGDGNWHNIIVTGDGVNWSGVKIYIDGTNVTSSATPESGLTVNSTVTYIGQNTYSPNRQFKGLIDEVAAWSREISSDEVNNLWNSGSPSNPMLLSGKPKAYYPLGEQARKPGTANWRFPNEVLQGQAINFDGTDYIESNLDLSGSSAFTASAWVKRDQNQIGYIVGQWGEGAASTSTWAISCGPAAELYFFVRSGSSTPLAQTTITNNEWTHVMGIWTGSQIQLYVNGTLQDTVSASSINNSTREFKIGVDDLNTYYFDGKISNVAIWNSDQTTNKDNIYNYGAPQTSYTVTPTAWYKLDKTSEYAGLNANWHNALSFDGNNDYVDLTQHDLGTVCSISLWLKKESGLLSATILGEPTNTFKNVYYIDWNANTLYFKDPSNNFVTWNTLSSVNDTDWHHYVVTRNGGDTVLYLDGVSQGAGTVGSALTGNTKFRYLGVNYPTNTQWFEGEISNLAIYNQVISAEDVKYLYNGGTPQTNISFEPTSWYKLDNTGTGIQDSGSASNNGTNNGATEVASNVAVDQWNFDNAVQSQTPNWSSALSFDGSSDYVDCGSFSALNSATQMSFSVWFNLDTSVINKGIIGDNVHFDIYTKTVSGSDYSLRLNLNGSSNRFQLTGSPFTAGKWHNLVTTFNAGTLNFYIDGNLAAYTVYSGSIPTSLSSSTGQLEIGRAAASLYWDGLISNTQIWTTELSAADALSIYNSGQPSTTAFGSPVSWWKLDNTTTGIQDSIGSNNGTNNGATEIQTNVWTPRLNGESDTLPSTALVSSDLQFNSAYSSFSLNFDSSSNTYINCGGQSLFNGLTAFSISCWIKTDGTQQDYAAIFSYQSSTSQYVKLAFYPSEKDRIRVVVRPGSSNPNYVKSSAGSIVDGEWVHIVAVGDANNLSNLNVYINGVLDNDVTQGNITTLAQSSDIYIGTDASATTTRDFNGKIDETAVWNRALNQAEITSIYNNGYPKDITALAPVSWWRLGEDAYFDGTDFTIPNKITGAPNGTSDNMAATALVADAPGSYAAGLGSSLVETDRVGNAALSTANSLSFNMIPSNRVSYPAGYVPTQADNVYSMAFDGTNYINGGNSLNFVTSNHTLSMWIKTTVNSNLVICEKGSNDELAIQTLAGGNVRWAGTNSFDTSSANINDGNWHHLAFVADGSSSFIYVNGVLNATGGNKIQASSNTNDFNIGSRAGTIGFVGSLDEVAIFDYALSARQIKQDIYNGTTSGKTADLNNISNLTAPVAWYRMGD